MRSMEWFYDGIRDKVSELEKYSVADFFSVDGEDEEKEVLIDGNSFHNNGK